jgi:hypothetical protein
MVSTVGTTMTRWSDIRAWFPWPQEPEPTELPMGSLVRARARLAGLFVLSLAFTGWFLLAVVGTIRPPVVPIAGLLFTVSLARLLIGVPFNNALWKDRPYVFDYLKSRNLRRLLDAAGVPTRWCEPIRGALLAGPLVSGLALLVRAG